MKGPGETRVCRRDPPWGDLPVAHSGDRVQPCAEDHLRIPAGLDHDEQLLRFNRHEDAADEALSGEWCVRDGWPVREAEAAIEARAREREVQAGLRLDRVAGDDRRHVNERRGRVVADLDDVQERLAHPRGADGLAVVGTIPGNGARPDRMAPDDPRGRRHQEGALQGTEACAGTPGLRTAKACRDLRIRHSVQPVFRCTKSGRRWNRNPVGWSPCSLQPRGGSSHCACSCRFLGCPQICDCHGLGLEDGLWGTCTSDPISGKTELPIATS